MISEPNVDDQLFWLMNGEEISFLEVDFFILYKSYILMLFQKDFKTTYISGQTPFGFNSLKVVLAGHHGKPNKMYVKAHSDGTVDCRETNFTEDVVCDVVQVKPDTVAFRSQFGKYLSGM